MYPDAFSRRHPLTNFMYFLGAIGFSVVVQHPAYLLASCLCAGLYLILLRGRLGWLTVMGMIPVFLVLSTINPLFNTRGERVLFYFLERPYTMEALLYGMVTAGIFVAMMLWFGCYSVVLTSDKFVCLFGSLIPSISMLLVMVLRLIPNLGRRGKKIQNARRCIGKGVSPEDKLKKKAVDSMDLLSALTDWALEGSIVTADSMRARGYGGAKRTGFQLYRMTAEDALLLGLMAGLLALTLAFGGMDAAYLPEIAISPLTMGFPAYCFYLMIPILLHGKEALQWRISISKI